jgi:hypothetical protein
MHFQSAMSGGLFAVSLFAANVVIGVRKNEQSRPRNISSLARASGRKLK